MTIGLLVAHFGDLARRRNAPLESSAAAPPEEFSPRLVRLRERLAHHLIPLALIARSDGEFAAVEREVIVSHCAAVAGLDADECALIEGYLRDSRPSLIQLDPALHRLEAEETHNLWALVDTVERVIVADGRVDPAEIRLLERMRDALATLGR